MKTCNGGLVQGLDNVDDFRRLIEKQTETLSKMFETTAIKFKIKTNKQNLKLDVIIALVRKMCPVKANATHNEHEEVESKANETTLANNIAMKPSATEESTKTELVMDINSTVFEYPKSPLSKKGSVFILILIVAWFPCSAKYDIHFEKLTYPIEFGRNATLLCSTDKSSFIGRFVWMKNSLIIGRDKTSIYPNKYTLKRLVNHTGLFYKLTIIAFNYSDVNSFYKCGIDFKSKETFLSLDEDSFIGKPEVIENNIGETVCSLTPALIIVQHAFPRPICQLYYEGIKYANALNISSMKEKYAYRTEIEIRELPCGLNCHGEISIKCAVGSRVYTIIKQKLNGCSGSDSFNPVYVHVAVIIGVFILLLCITIVIYKVYQRRNAGAGHQESEVEQVELCENKD